MLKHMLGRHFSYTCMYLSVQQSENKEESGDLWKSASATINNALLLIAPIQQCPETLAAKKPTSSVNILLVLLVHDIN